MTGFLICLSGLFFALWRRSFGGWLGGGKVARHAVAGAFWALVGAAMGVGPEIWISIFALSIPHWQFGHELDGPAWKTTIRYGAAPAVLAVAAFATGHWAAAIPLALIGPASAALCWLALRPSFRAWCQRFARHPIRLLDRDTAFIDGHLAFCELGIGLAWGLGAACALAMI